MEKTMTKENIDLYIANTKKAYGIGLKPNRCDRCGEVALWENHLVEAFYCTDCLRKGCKEE